MVKVSFSDCIGVAGIVLGVLLVVLDKAGKLKGGWLYGLLVVAGVMTLFVAIGNEWVMDAPTKWKLWRGLFMFCLVGLTYSGLAIWISPSEERLANVKPGGDEGQADKPSIAPVTVHSARPTITMSEYGSEPGSKIYAVIRVESPPPTDAPFRLLLVTRVQDSTVDEMEDTQIEKSSLRPVTGQTIEVVVPQRFLERAYHLKFVRVVLVLLPAQVQSAQISKLSDVIRMGGEIAINNSFVMPLSASAVHPAQASQAKPQVTLATHLQPGPYPSGYVFAGIVWDEAYSDVRLDISVGNVAIRDLDFLVSLDTTIMGVGQITQFPGCTAFPPSSNLSAFTLEGTDKKGKNVATPIDPTPGNAFGAPTYRVHCTEVFGNVVVRFAIASRALNPTKADGRLPDHLFAPRRDPQIIKVEGTYKADGLTYPLKYSVKLQKAAE